MIALFMLGDSSPVSNGISVPFTLRALRHLVTVSDRLASERVAPNPDRSDILSGYLEGGAIYVGF